MLKYECNLFGLMERQMGQNSDKKPTAIPLHTGQMHANHRFAARLPALQCTSVIRLLLFKSVVGMYFIRVQWDSGRLFIQMLSHLKSHMH